MNYKYTDPFGVPPQSPSLKNKKTKKNPYWLIFFFAILVIAGLVLYFFHFSKDTNKEEEQVQKEVASLLNEVSKISVLPQEEPVIFTISDANALIQEQQFFLNSQNGDILLIFRNAMKAVIYSPSRKIIVNMGPVTSEKPIVSGNTSGIEEQQQITTPTQEEVEQVEETQIQETEN